MKSLQTILAEERFERVTVLRIDTEGAERALINSWLGPPPASVSSHGVEVLAPTRGLPYYESCCARIWYQTRDVPPSCLTKSTTLTHKAIFRSIYANMFY